MTEREPDISCSLVPRFNAPDELSRPSVLRLSVGPDIVLDMLPYPTAARSCVTRRALADCYQKLGRQQLDRPGILLDDLLIGGRSLPPLWVVPSLAPTRLDVDGFLGYDFFSQFQVVEWHPNTGFLRLRYP